MIGLSINEDGQGKYILGIRKGKLPMTAKPAEVASLDPITMQTLCEEYIANNYIDPETSEKLGVKRGLRQPGWHRRAGGADQCVRRSRLP